MKASRLGIAICSVIALAMLLVSGVRAPAQPQARGKQAPRDQSNAAFDQAVKLGDEARQADQLPQALNHYATALKIRPDWKEGWWNLGAILYEQDHYPEARDAFRNLLSLDANNGSGWGMLGLCEFQTREYDRAITSLLRGRSLGLAGNPELESVVRYHA